MLGVQLGGQSSPRAHPGCRAALAAPASLISNEGAWGVSSEGYSQGAACHMIQGSSSDMRNEFDQLALREGLQRQGFA